jgi:hypothetical protein
VIGLAIAGVIALGVTGLLALLTDLLRRYGTVGEKTSKTPPMATT